MASSKEQIWLAEYLKCFNATEAARRAGYAHPNTIGPRKKKKFSAEIEAALEEKVIEADEALARLSDIANFDPSPYIEKIGRIITLNTNAMIDDGYGHLIREVYTTKDGPRVKIADQDWAIELVLKHHTRGADGTEDSPVHVVIRHE